MTNDPGMIVSGFYALPGGMDSGVDPSLLEKDKSAFAVNTIFRGGIPTHRPPFAKVALDFGGNTVLETRATTGKFQVAGQYQPDNANECILASIGGRLFRFNVADDNSVQELTITFSILSTAPFTIPAVDVAATLDLVTTTGLSINAVVLFGGVNYTITGILNATQVSITNIDGTAAVIVATGTPLFFYDVNPATQDRAWYKQAENYAIFQNNQNLPIIYDGASTRRAVSNPPNPTDAREIPIGNIMEYSKQRLIVALPDSRTYAIGDLAYSSSGLLPNGRDSVLKFTQNQFQNSGKNFTVPQTCGGIRSLTAVPLLDGALDQGPCMVGTPEIIFSLNLPTDATTWAGLTSPIQAVAMQNNGTVSDRGTVLVNGDVWYRRYDGWGSLTLARRDFNTWANTSVSSEMDRVLPFDDSSLLTYENGVFFDGRILKTVSPARSPFGIFHRGIIALDLNRVSGLRAKLPPAYDGLWTGLNTLQFVAGTFAGVERCFAFSVNYAGVIELFEILKDGEFDDYGDGPNVRIVWSMETGVVGQATVRGGGPFDLKRLENAELWIDNVFGNVDLKAWIRPMGAVCWTPWRDNLRTCATTNTCSDLPTGACQTPVEFRAQYRSRIGFGKPPDTCDRNENRPVHTAEGWQLRIESTGHFRVRGLKVYSRLLTEPISEPACCPPPTTTAPIYFFNSEQSFTATCPEGETGMPVTVTIPANTFAAGTQAEADETALEAAQIEAEAALVCV